MRTTTSPAGNLDLNTVEGVAAALALMRNDNLPDDVIDESDVFGALAFMPVSELKALVDAAPYCPLLVALAVHLEWISEELNLLNAEMRKTEMLNANANASARPRKQAASKPKTTRKQPGKVVKLRALA